MDTNGKQWRVAQWPMLAWVETAIKLVAIGLALVTAFTAFSRGNFGPATGNTWIELVILIVLSLGLFAAIFDRILEREIVAMVFIILNNLGHWGMTISLLASPKPDQALLIFCTLMLIGDLTKLVFLKRYDFKVRDTPKSLLYGLTIFYILGYLSLVMIELVL